MENHAYRTISKQKAFFFQEQIHCHTNKSRELLPVWHTGWNNLGYIHISLQNYPFINFLLSILFYFTLQVNSWTRATEEPRPHPGPAVNSCNTGIQTGVNNAWIQIFVAPGACTAVPSMHWSTAHNQFFYYTSWQRQGYI